MKRYRPSAIGYQLALAMVGFLAVLPSCRLVAQTDPRLVAAVRLAQEGQGDSARIQVKRVLDATPASSPLYAEALFATGVVAASTAEMERHFQRLVVEFNGSAWSDDALLRLIQLNFAKGDLAAVIRTSERLAGDYPQSEVIPDAAKWAARAYFRQQSVTDGCRWLADGLARSDTLNVELRNELTFLNGRCGQPTQAPLPRDSVPAVVVPPRADTVTPLVGPFTNGCVDNCWSIQVGVSATRALANDLVARLERDGFPGARVGQEGAVFKIRIGGYTTRTEIDPLLARIRVKYPQAFAVGPR